MLRFRALFFPLRFSRSSFPHPTPCFGRCAPVLAFRPASASHFGPRTPARTPVPCSGRRAPVLRSGPVFRAAYPGPVLRPRPAPTFCPALWVADLKGGFWKEAFAFRAQAPVPAFWPCVPALTTRSSRPGSSHSALRRPRTSTHAPRLALRSYTPAPCSGRDGSCASSPHSGPRAPTPAPRPRTRPRTRPRASAHAPRLALRSRVPGGALRSRAPVPCSGRRTPVPCSDPDLPPTFCPTLWAADSGGGSCPRAPSRISFRVPALAPRPRAPVPCSGRRTPVPCSDPDLPPTFCPTLWAADSGGGSCPRAPSRISFRVPALAPRPRAPVPCSGRRTPVPCSDPDLPPTFCPTLWAADSGGGSCPRAPSRISFRVPALAPRLLHSRPAFRAAVLKEGFRATFWNVAFRAAVLKEGGYAAVPV